jgi:hypothetical protein
MKEISKIRDPREAFLRLLEVEKRIDLLELPKDLEMRSSIEQRFS